MTQIVTKPRPEKAWAGGPQRICPPQETYDRIKGFFPVMGITRVANVTGLDRIGIPVYAAYRPNSRSVSVSQGKGYTPEAAKVSAAMESIEAWHAENIQLPLKIGSYNDLRYSHHLVDVAKLPKPRQTDFTPNQKILWIEGYDLLAQAAKWVPYEMVHLDYRAPLPTGHGCFFPSSNGLASGNNMQEAMIHGLCEVTERDALTLWYLKDPALQKGDRVDLSTVRDIACLSILEKFNTAQVHVGVWDITSSVGVPAFLCRILPDMEPDISGMRPASGMGCHVSRDVALLRALTEAAQSRLTFISGGRDDLRREEYQSFLRPEEYELWRNTLTDTAAQKDYRSIHSIATNTQEDDLDLLLQRLRHAGISEAVVVNLTRPEFGIPVTRMIVPGLETLRMEKSVFLGERAGRVLRERERS